MFGKNPICANSSIINDIYQSIIPEEIQKRKNINQAILTDSEIITISLVGELLIIDSQNA